MRKSSKTKKSLASAGLITLVGGALLIPSASAGREDGRFFIHAWNTDDPQFRATAGLQGLSTVGGGSGEVPVDEDTSTILTSFECGPMSFAITESMLKLSESNLASADEPKRHPQGWSFIYGLNGETFAMDPGLGTTGGPYEIISLSTSRTAPGAIDVMSNADPNSKVSLLRTAAACSISDGSVPSSSKSPYFYTQSGPDSYAEGRYISSIPTVVTKSSGGSIKSTKIERYEGTSLSSHLKSEVLPALITIFEDGSTSARLDLPVTKDGYNQVAFSRDKNGTLTASFSLASNTTVDRAKRQLGPVSLGLNSDGRFTDLIYYDGSKEVSLPYKDDGYSIEDYNRISGQNWDGKFPKVQDFDTVIPFEPTAP